MDETTTGTENTGQAEGETKSQTPPAAASEGEAGTTPKEDTPTLTQTQAEEIATKAVNDALAKAGRDAKSLAKQREELENWQKYRDEVEAKKDEDELERYKDDPERLDVVKERQKLRKEKSDHEKWWRERQADVEAANAAKLEITCFEIAQEYDIKPEDLKDAVIELDLKTEEQIKAQAKWMSKGKPEAPSDDKGNKPPAAPPKPPDSGRNMGGGEKNEQQKLDERYPTMKK
jgi:hypothetical protein